MREMAAFGRQPKTAANPFKAQTSARLQTHFIFWGGVGGDGGGWTTLTQLASCTLAGLGLVVKGRFEFP